MNPETVRFIRSIEAEQMERESESKNNTSLVTVVVVLLAVLLRLVGLGSASLTMNEAENAMTALHLFENGSRGQLLYELPTAILFKFFGSSEFIARLFPALAGILLALIPLFFYKNTGSRKALVLSFFLAVDPVLLFWSKRADAVIPAAALLAAAVVFLLKQKKTAALTCFLIALNGGERIWPVVLICAVCLVLSTVLLKNDPYYLWFLRFSKRNFFLGAAFFVLFDTAFGAFPGGIGGFGTGIINSFRKGPAWVYPGLAAELIAVVLYCGMPLLLSFVDAIRNRRVPALLLSVLAAAGLILWYGVIMLPWISILLWINASGMVLKILDRIKGPFNFPFLMTGFAITGAWSFFYFRLVELFKQTNGNELIQFNWNNVTQTIPLTRYTGAVLLTVISVVIIGLIVKILLGFVESGSVRRGLLAGMAVILSWSLMTGIWNAGGFDREGDHPLMVHSKNTAAILNGAYTSFTNNAFFELFDETIAKHGDASNTNYGLNFIVNDPMAAWLIRNNPGIHTTANKNADLTGVDLILDQAGDSYESYGFVSTRQNWRGTMDWRTFSFQNWGKWLIFGDAQPAADVPVTLWARAERFFMN